MTARPRPGRRGGDADTREAILAAARMMFAADGYAGTSLRAIARTAGVDAALVHHYFDDKAAVFAAALAIPLQPALVAHTLLDGDPACAGERLATLFISLWENDTARPSLLALVRAATTEEQAAAMLRDFLQDGILRHVAAAMTGPDAQLRATLLGGQLVGTAMLRYVVRMPPLAEAAPADVVRWLAPALQHHLTGAGP
ncbi:MAG: putative TetR-family transcriptional regulator [Frankiales bacterium]|nr:putative TetR-family transcriptional regulator [Frankiales bacterium]